MVAMVDDDLSICLNLLLLICRELVNMLYRYCIGMIFRYTLLRTSRLMRRNCPNLRCSAPISSQKEKRK